MVSSGGSHERRASPRHTQITLKHNELTDQESPNSLLLDRICQLEFLFVTGKGGVGKSSITAALALHAAARGRTVLVLYPGDSEPHPDLWGRSIDGEPRPVTPGISAVSVNPEAAMRQYSGEVLGSAKLASVLFHHKVAWGLLTEIPGPSEWAILGKAWSFTKTGAAARKRGEMPYDLVIVDAPSSGDGSGMLKMPQVVIDLSPAAVLRRDAESCLLMLKDETKSAVVFVTLAEELSVSETEENMELVRRQLGMPLGPIIVNQVIPAEFSVEDESRLLAIPVAIPAQSAAEAAPETLSPEERTLRCLTLGQHIATRQRLQNGYLARVASWGLPVVKLPHLPGDLVGVSALRKLQMALAAGH